MAKLIGISRFYYREIVPEMYSKETVLKLVTLAFCCQQNCIPKEVSGPALEGIYMHKSIHISQGQITVPMVL